MLLIFDNDHRRQYSRCRNRNELQENVNFTERPHEFPMHLHPKAEKRRPYIFGMDVILSDERRGNCFSVVVEFICFSPKAHFPPQLTCFEHI